MHRGLFVCKGGVCLKYPEGLITYVSMHWITTVGIGQKRLSCMSTDIVLSPPYNHVTKGSDFRLNAWLQERSGILRLIIFAEYLSKWYEKYYPPVSLWMSTHIHFIRKQYRIKIQKVK